MSDQNSMEHGALKLIFDDRALHIEFVNLFHVNTTPEYVILTPIQRFPEADEPVPEGVLPDQLPPSGRVVGRFAITWPHVVRLRDLLNRLVEKYMEDANKGAEGIIGGAAQSEGTPLDGTKD